MMASEDVIELGSSDEESEPAPKRANISKRRPNAMVQFPPGVTIKHSKPANNHINPIRKLIGKGLTVTKVNPTIKQISPNIRNGKQPPTKPIKLPQIQNVKSLNPIPIPVPRFPVMNPFNMVKKLNTPGIVPFSKSTPFYPIRIQSPSSINNLPSSITITKKPGPAKISGVKPLLGKISGGGKISVGVKRSAATSISNVKKKQKIRPEPPITVNLDDEDVPTTSTASPQWYMRPEDTTDPLIVKPHEEEQSMEKQNNTEPKQFIEITIEDSPIKPVQNKRTHEIGAELAITIDDSPVKVVAAKATNSADSDNDTTEESAKEKQSKKKLEYPKEDENHQYAENTTIEIELEPINNDAVVENNVAIEKSDAVEVSEENNKKKREIVHDSIIEVFESPAKTVQTPPSTPKKVEPEIHKIKSIAISAQSSEPEFHPVYQEFIDLCLKIENSNDMNTIVEKKIKSYYRQVPKEYTESEEFVELVQSKLFSMKAGPEKLYLYIKDIVDELNLQRKIAKAKPILKESSSIEAEKFQYGEESEFDLKRQRQIRKLEKTLKKLHRAIQKLEEQEVDFDDEEDSVYLLTESDDSSSSIKDLDRQLEREHSVLLKRYKERMVRVHAKFCQLTNTKMPSEPRIQIQARPGQPGGPAKRLEKWVNKKVPIGKPLPFPDFHDVLKCVRDANTEDKLGWNEAEIMEEARDLFTRCGKKLQRRRQENEWRLAASRISMEVDPAENSEDLKNKLDSNKQMSAKKETEVFNKFADKQSQMNLEAIEISDKEADESPVESEDEEPQEEISTLENKEKRKERLRRLINEKSKKTEDKERKSKNVSPSPEKATCENESERAKIDAKKEETKKMEIDLVPEEINKDNTEVAFVPQGLNTERKESSNSIEKAHSISGESKVDSDVDELHLLQKLHSDEVNTSTIESTDSDSPVDISDTLTSSDNKKPINSDVISIENSSYSETESKDCTTSKVESIKANIKENKEKNVVDIINKNDTIVPRSISGEIECSYASIQLNKTNNQEYNESVESILLASTDDEGDDDANKNKNPKTTGDCVNLKDDDISIGETFVEKIGKNKIGKESNNKTSRSLPIEHMRSSDKNTIDSEVRDLNLENSNETAICKTLIEEKQDSLKKVESNCKNNAIANDGEGIEEIHSVESIDSDGQGVSTERLLTPTVDTKQLESNVNHSVVLMGTDNISDETGSCISVVSNEQQLKSAQEMDIRNENSDVINHPSIESLEFDNSQSVKEIEDALLNVIKESGVMETVETLDSDNSQEAAKGNVTDKQSPDMTENPSVETLESDNSQSFKEIEDALLNVIQESEVMETVETLDSDNSQEAAEGNVTDKQSLDITENPSVETLESDNSQELASSKSESPTDVNKETGKVSTEIQELIDSNSSVQPDEIHELGETELNETSKLGSVCPASTKTIDCLLDDQVMPDVAQNDNST